MARIEPNDQWHPEGKLFIEVLGQNGKGTHLYVGNEDVGWAHLNKKRMRELHDALTEALGEP